MGSGGLPPVELPESAKITPRRLVARKPLDRTTGDETGPPYDDPLINKIAFVVFIGATLLFVALCGIALVRRISRRS